MAVELKIVKIEYGVILFKDDGEPEPPLYDDCAEAQAVVEFAGGGVVVMKGYYETGWNVHERH
jgi:hypothetical protein